MYLSGWLPYHANDWFSWWIYDMLPKSGHGTDIFFLGGNPAKVKAFTAWHIKPRSVFPHTRRYRLIKAICQKDINDIKDIIDSNFDIDNQIIDPTFGFTVMTLCAALNRIGIIEYLLLRGANINATDTLGNSPLMIAVINWQYDTIKYLVEHGADLELKDKYGFDAIEKAEMRTMKWIAKYLREQKQAKHQRNFPKFDIEYDFESKFKDSAENLHKQFRYYKARPRVYPFNNLTGTYIVNFITYETSAGVN